VLLSALGVAGIPLSLVLSGFVAVIVLGFRLEKEIGLHFHFLDIGRLLFSGAALFVVGACLVKMDIQVLSWVEFISYLVSTVTGVLIMYISMNWALCQDMYKRVVYE